MVAAMEENKVISYIENMELIPDQKYVVECGIEFTYKPEKEKPYVLNNGYSLDHIPTKTDKRTNNLVNLSAMDKETVREITSKGGKESARVQAKRRSFKDSLDMILSIKASKEEIESLPLEVQQYFNNSGIIPTKEDLINIRAVELAIIGSDKHMVFSRDTVGEKPTDNTNINANVITEGDNLLLEKIAKRLLIDHQEQ